jgi:uncharacterized protein YwqG
MSKVGGLADLPRSTKWPMLGSRPLAFIAQIDLAEVHPFDLEEVLPAEGLLSFFYDAARQTAWGHEPGDRSSWAILFSPPGNPLERREHPGGLVPGARFGEKRLLPVSESTLAPWESPEVHRILDDSRQEAAYCELFNDPDGVTHRLLGHPDPIQGDMPIECQLISQGLSCENGSRYDHPHRERLARGADQWRLLLQIDSDEDLGMCFADLGRLYFWIRSPDLAARRWEKAWLILQCS